MFPTATTRVRQRAGRPVHRLVVALAAVALVLGACTGSGTNIDDPTDILVQSYEAMQDVETVRVDVSLEGEAPLDLAADLEIFGQAMPSFEPGTGGTIDLAGTTIVAEIDVEAEALRVQFAAPALLDVSGEIIAVDEVAYVKASVFGDKYFRMEPEDEAMPSPEPTASVDAVAELREALDELATPPEKLADEPCGDTDCYHIRLVVDPAELDKMAGDEPLPSALPADVGPATVDVWIRKNDLHVSQVTIVGDSGAGDATATVAFSRYGDDLAIEAPPADQVTDEPLPLPSGLGG